MYLLNIEFESFMASNIFFMCHLTGEIHTPKVNVHNIEKDLTNAKFFSSLKISKN
jgi:hypothetical protein